MDAVNHGKAAYPCLQRELSCGNCGSQGFGLTFFAGKHPELTRKCSLLEDVKKQRLRIAERYQEQRRKNIEQQYEAEKKQVLDQHEVLSWTRDQLLALSPGTSYQFVTTYFAG